MVLCYNARRETRRPIRGSVLWLRFVVAFCDIVSWYRLVLEPVRMFTPKVPRRKSYTWGIYLTTTSYTPNILHLTLIRCNLLIINTLISVRYYQIHFHTTYTTYLLPHGTSTGGRYHGIGEQKSLSLRQNLLRPCAVKSTAYDKTDCEAAGVMCKMYAGACKMFWNHLTLLKHLCFNLLRTKSVRWQ